MDTLVQKLAKQTNLKPTSVFHALKKLQVQELKLPDLPHRLHFCLWFLNFVQTHGVAILDQVYFSNEAGFHRAGYINARNYGQVRTHSFSGEQPAPRENWSLVRYLSKPCHQPNFLHIDCVCWGLPGHHHAIIRCIVGAGRSGLLVSAGWGTCTLGSRNVIFPGRLFSMTGSFPWNARQSGHPAASIYPRTASFCGPT